MGQKLSAQDMALYRAVDEVLHYVWDPIGVAGTPQARDEYYGYLPRVFALVRDCANESAIAEELSSIATQRMGLLARPEHDLEIARLLLSWRESVNERLA